MSPTRRLVLIGQPTSAQEQMLSVVVMIGTVMVEPALSVVVMTVPVCAAEPDPEVDVLVPP